MIHLHRIGGSPRARVGLSLAAWGIASFAVTLLVVVGVVRFRSRLTATRSFGTVPTRPGDSPIQEQPSPFEAMVYPTVFDLLGPANGVLMFMPPASGNPTSALFGSARTGSDGLSRFHAGVDIAPSQRDRQGRPLDTVGAIADGKVAFVNRVGGDSSYGVYVVLIHDDPVGTVYTLYAHLASVPRELLPGGVVRAGAPVGIMGNSANTGVPLARAHLHLEIGVLLSDRFGMWSNANKLKPNRGNYHGWNLFAVDPLDVYARRRGSVGFSFAKYLESVPAAFEILLCPRRRLDYFNRYPNLWRGPTDYHGPQVLRVSEGGVILLGRPATESETVTYEAIRKPTVQNVDEAVLGRNGMHLVAKINGRWMPGRAATRWLELLTY
jgi:murein DD-endopeptidase MepM/ murein hydrolase activator NlpD